MAPVFEGLGYGMIFVRSCVNIYYVVICAWAFFYLFAGMTSELPWGTCTEDWNTYDCYTLKYAQVKLLSFKFRNAEKPRERESERGRKKEK